MNPFVNPDKRSISLPKGCKNLADVLGRPDLAARNPIRRFITLVLMQAEQDCATELVIGTPPEAGGSAPLKYKANGFWYDMSPFPSAIRPKVIRDLGKMAGLKKLRFPIDCVIGPRLGKTVLLWRVRIASLSADCVLTKDDV